MSTNTETDKTASTGPGTMVDVMKYFEMRPGDFKKEWDALPISDRDDLKNGVGKLDKASGEFSGPMTY